MTVYIGYVCVYFQIVMLIHVNAQTGGIYSYSNDFQRALSTWFLQTDLVR